MISSRREGINVASNEAFGTCEIIQLCFVSDTGMNRKTKQHSNRRKMLNDSGVILGAVFHVEHHVLRVLAVLGLMPR